MTEKTFLQRVAERQTDTTPPPSAPIKPIKPVTPPPARHLVDADSEPARKRRYAEKALRDECDLVSTAANGTRNHTLNKAAFCVARFVTEGILGPDEVTTELTAAARAAGLPDAEIRATLASAARGALAKPREQPAVPESSIGANVLEVDATSLNGHTPDDEDADDENEPVDHGILDAAEWLFDGIDTTTCLWGSEENILWAEGEALMIAGGMGLGKTTLAGQLLRAQLGLDHEVIGLPVTPIEGPILYLAMDRPRQIRRSMLRQFDHTERAQIEGRLLIRVGPPVADIAVRPTLLAEMAMACGASTIYLDSLKDAAVGLSSDEVGAAYNRARQFVLAHDIQLCELHHLIKRNPLGGAPSSVADVYGSNWLTAGAGSVIMLTGDPGDPIVSFRHVKQPFNEVGPYRLLHDQHSGRFSVDHEVDLLALATAAGPTGLSPQGAAAAIFEKDKPSRAQIEKARRRLDKLVTAGKLVRIEGMKGGVAGGVSANYFVAH